MPDGRLYAADGALAWPLAEIQSMTAQDSRRAQFEAWVAQNHPAAPLDRIPSRPDEYDGILAAWTWAAWQAASALPSAQPEPAACIYKVQSLVPEIREVTRVALYRPLSPGTLLYTANVLPPPAAMGHSPCAMQLAGVRVGGAFRQSVADSPLS